jgi:hypothetical protein
VAQKSWNDSATACHNVGAQLVVIKSDEEQVCLVRPIKDTSAEDTLRPLTKGRGGVWLNTMFWKIGCLPEEGR